MTVTRTHIYETPGVKTITASDGTHTATTQVTVLDATPPTMTVNPTEVQAGNQITVSGSDFTPGDTGTFCVWSGATGGEVVVCSGQLTADDAGAVATTPIVIPAATPAGDYRVVAEWTASVAAAVPITVTAAPVDPAVSVTPTSVVAGGDVTVSGTDFPASTAGQITIAPAGGGAAIVTQPVTTTATGAIGDTVVTIPAATAAGAYTVTATVDTASAETALEVTAAAVPAITATPASIDSTAAGAGARTITVDGNNFTASTAGTIGLYTGAPESGGELVVEANVTTTAAGGFEGAGLVVPLNQLAGDYHIVAAIGDDTVDDTAITVTGGTGGGTLAADKTRLDVDGGVPSRTVTVSGTGFAASAAGRVAVNSGTPGSGGTEIIGADVNTDTAGAFGNTVLEVPTGTAAGDAHILTSGAIGVSDDTALTLISGGGAALLNPDKTSVPGTGTAAERTVTVIATGLTPSTQATIAILPGAPGSGGTAIISATDTSDTEGELIVALEVPDQTAAGEHHITCEQGGTVTSDDTALTVTAPQQARAARRSRR